MPGEEDHSMKYLKVLQYDGISQPPNFARASLKLLPGTYETLSMCSHPEDEPFSPILIHELSVRGSMVPSSSANT